MYNSFRFVSMVLILLVVVLTGALVQPEWARDVELDSDIEQSLRYCGLLLQGRVNEPGPLVEAISQRYSAKERISIEVLDGRLTLFEAAALFRHLNRDNPVLPMIRGCPGNSEEELYCWQVIEFVAGMEARRCHGSPGEKESSGCLKEELRRHIEQHQGQVLLPDANLDSRQSTIASAACWSAGFGGRP